MALKAVFLLITTLTFTSSAAHASHWNISNLQSHIGQILHSATGWNSVGGTNNLESLLKKAAEELDSGNDFQGLFDDVSVQFQPTSALGDDESATVRFVQTYQGVEVVGNDAMVHFDKDGEVGAVTGSALQAAVDVEPSLTPYDALQLLRDRYQENIRLSEPAKLKVLKNFTGSTHLTYHMLTRSTATHDGQEVYIDAHDGAVVLEFPRAYHVHSDHNGKGNRTVYSAATDEARQPGRIDAGGYPTDLDLTWYEKVIEDNQYNLDAMDRSAMNAYRASGRVYEYYLDNFNRKSFDDQDSRIVSVVHIGVKMNNAFWTNEYKIMGYGDGDGKNLVDLTYGLDVTAHEITHGVTASTAQLVYAAEPGALNESYSDFFAKMVDYNGDWLVGEAIMAPGSKRRALRNMENPEEFKQPGSNDSELRRRTDVLCTRSNDRCGVHVNSGIPNRAAVLIVKAIGKEKTEQLYYRVLTRHLSAMSGFADARRETEKACALKWGEDSYECKSVTKAFDTVKM